MTKTTRVSGLRTAGNGYMKTDRYRLVWFVDTCRCSWWVLGSRVDEGSIYIYMSFNKFYKMLNNGINMHAFHVGLNIFSPPCFQLHVGHTSIVSLVGVKF